MLQCNKKIAAMQTSGLRLASGIPTLFVDYEPLHETGLTMTETASLRLSPSAGLFARFMAIVDRLDRAIFTAQQAGQEFLNSGVGVDQQQGS